MAETQTETITTKVTGIKVARKHCNDCGHEWRARQGEAGRCPECQKFDVRDVTVKVSGHKCMRCDHEWQPRYEDAHVTVCPKCKSPWWRQAPKARKAKKR